MILEILVLLFKLAIVCFEMHNLALEMVDELSLCVHFEFNLFETAVDFLKMRLKLLLDLGVQSRVHPLIERGAGPGVAQCLL